MVEKEIRDELEEQERQRNENKVEVDYMEGIQMEGQSDYSESN